MHMKTKDKILQAALKLFKEHGSSSITTNHIADEMGISPGSLYYHFNNKEEIIRALFVQMNEELDGNLSKIPQDGINMESLVEVFRLNFRLVLQYPLFAREIFALMQKDPELKKLFQESRVKRFVEIENTLDNLEKAEVMRFPKDEASKASLTEMIWVLAFFWTPYLSMIDEPLNEASVDRGMYMVLDLLKPYLNN